MDTAWETELATLLSELSSVQDDLLDLLTKKRQFLVKTDIAGMQSLAGREQELIERLQACQQNRSRLLERAGQQGLPRGSIRALAAALPAPGRKELARQVQDASTRARLLQHQSLTNWVLVQRTLLHLSQLLEIIATGGRMRTTYGKGEHAHASGALVDRAA